MNVNTKKFRKLTLANSIDLLMDPLGREANTRRPTLPPSAHVLDGKTAAAEKNKERFGNYCTYRRLAFEIRQPARRCSKRSAGFLWQRWKGFLL